MSHLGYDLALAYIDARLREAERTRANRRWASRLSRSNREPDGTPSRPARHSVTRSSTSVGVS